jgi:hypothetical protein
MTVIEEGNPVAAVAPSIVAIGGRNDKLGFGPD